jgi:penicillin-binding protein 1A
LSIFDRFKKSSGKQTGVSGKTNDSTPPADKLGNADGASPFSMNGPNSALDPLRDEEPEPNGPASGLPSGNLNSSPLPKKKRSLVGGTFGAIGAVGKGIVRPFTGPRPLQKRPLFWLGLTTGIGALALGGLWVFVDQSVSKFSMKEPLSFARPGTMTIKGNDGTKLLQLGSDTSETLKLWQFPDKLKQAFIAIEDRRFYEHDGVDYKGVTRAMVSNITTRGLAEGASSITQQVARMVYLDNDKNFWRKLKEVRLAQKIEKELGKDQILERYLNLVYLGEGTYGVADAAWVYFGKTIDKLTLPQMAMLAALPPAPNKYSPFVNEKFAKDRRNLVLLRMQEAGFITAAEMAEAKTAPLGLKKTEHKQKFQQARYFTKYIEQELATGKYISPEDLKSGGLIVETTLNPQWQTVAEDVIKSTVRNNSGSFGQAAMVSIEPRSGAIRTMVGGKEFSEKNQFNRVTQAMRQPGSTFKPILYTTAIAGGISPNKSYVDAPLDVDGYKPKNAGKGFKGSISMRGALTNSINIVAIKILIDTGFQPVMDLASKMGIESELKPYYSLALGGLEVNLLELTNAYSTFASMGMHEKVHGIQRILDRKGNVLYENKLDPQRVLQSNNVAIAISLMRGVVTEGTGVNAQLADRPVAGKTGTTDKERDLWFMGYIPQLVTGVWLGNDNNRPTGNASSTAAYAWHRFMAEAVKGMPVQQFPTPDYAKQKAEIKLDPVRPGYMKTLAAPKEDDPKGKEAGDSSSNSSSQDRPSRRRARVESSSGSSSSNSEDRPSRRRARVESSGDSSSGSSEDRPSRRRARSEESSGGGEAQPRRRARSENSGGSEAQPRSRSRSESGGSAAPRRRSSASEDEG